jgi:hypothetical protein
MDWNRRPLVGAAAARRSPWSGGSTQALTGKFDRSRAFAAFPGRESSLSKVHRTANWLTLCGNALSDSV